MHRGSAASRACTSAPGRALCPQRAASAPGLSQGVPPLWPLLLTAQARSHAGPMALPGTVSRDPHQPRPHGCRGHQVGSAASLERCSFPQAQPESQERGHFLSSHRCMLLPITNVTGTAFKCFNEKKVFNPLNSGQHKRPVTDHLPAPGLRSPAPHSL